MKDGKQKLLAILCGLWIALVVAYMIWSAVAYAGLYRWLAEQQVAQWGGYYEKWTVGLPILILSAPALAYLGRISRTRQAQEAGKPAAEARSIRRTAWFCVLAGVLGLAIGGGAYALSQSIPDGSERAEPFDAARLGSGPVSATKVRIEGIVDPDAVGSVERRGSANDRVTFYAAFHPDGEAKGAPVRLFIERGTPRREALTTMQAFLPEQTGYLVENGVPELALSDLRARGVQIASPHWLLKTRDGALRDPYYVVAALGGFIGLICLMVGGVGFLQARRRAWLATAIRVDVARDR
jgi:hypothetical protein